MKTAMIGFVCSVNIKDNGEISNKPATFSLILKATRAPTSSQVTWV